ncbi:MAG: hypothetical protein H7Y17_16290 [Chlorobia bacterium]|nr:hypothetical protein [Fimbriimonadaceae bacterium]
MDENSPPQYAAYPRATDPRQYNGPPDFRINAINEAWLIYKSDFGTWLGGYVIIILMSILLQVPAGTYVFWRMSTSGEAAATGTDVLVVSLVAGIISSAVSGVLHGGYLRLAIQKMRLRHEGIGGLFNLNGQGAKIAIWSVLYSLPILVISQVYSNFSSQQTNSANPDLGTLFGSMLLFFGAMVIVALLIFPFFLTPMLLVDQKMSIMQAASRSWQQVAKMYFRALGFYIVMAIIGASGVLACGIGVIFTLPLYQLAIAVAYRDNFMPPLSESQTAYSPEGAQPPGSFMG